MLPYNQTQKRVSAQIIPECYQKGPIASKQRLYTSDMILQKVTRLAPSIMLGQHYICGHSTLTENRFNSTEESKVFDAIVGSNPCNDASVSRLFQRSSITMLALVTLWRIIRPFQTRTDTPETQPQETFRQYGRNMNAIFCPTGLSKHMLGQPHKCNASYNLGSCLLNKYPYFIGLLM